MEWACWLTPQAIFQNSHITLQTQQQCTRGLVSQAFASIDCCRCSTFGHSDLCIVDPCCLHFSGDIWRGPSFHVLIPPSVESLLRQGVCPRLWPIVGSGCLFTYCPALQVLCVFWRIAFLIRYVFCKYFPTACALSLYSLDRIFHRAETFNFNKVYLISYFCHGWCFGAVAKSHCQILNCLDSLLSMVLMFDSLYLGLWSTLSYFLLCVCNHLYIYVYMCVVVYVYICLYCVCVYDCVYVGICICLCVYVYICVCYVCMYDCVCMCVYIGVCVCACTRECMHNTCTMTQVWIIAVILSLHHVGTRDPGQVIRLGSRWVRGDMCAFVCMLCMCMWLCIYVYVCASPCPLS